MFRARIGVGEYMQMPLEQEYKPGSCLVEMLACISAGLSQFNRRALLALGLERRGRFPQGFADAQHPSSP
eukprot:6212863-Pleurochrysis_carterae.AAC.1